jgi:hypothetical protein
MEDVTTLAHIMVDLPVILEEMTFKRGSTVHLWTTNKSQIQLGAILTFITMTNGKIGELPSLQSLLDIII